MDFLSRLIAGTGSSPTKQKPNTPAERLATCKRICNALQQIWRSGSSLSEDDPTTAHLANYLKRLTAILHDESRKAAPHSCLLYTASTQIYIIITKLALSSQDPEIIEASGSFFHILIHGEAEGLLDSKIFARSLIDLVRTAITASTTILDDKREADLVELLFEIATKIRLDSDILPAWFYPERDRSRTRDSLSGEARKNQFPLFYVLVEYVHLDGPAGDFARTGLLYLIETASKSKPLEQWLIESDIAPQMASGLGALYSRLSRRLPSLPTGESLPPIIALSDCTTTDRYADDSKVEFQENVKAFLSYLAFWQDTLNHCYSQEVTDTLLDHFQVLFVQQLLYPSLLESSDVDGGSTAPVISHLYRILDALEQVGLVQGILRYLLATPEKRKPGDQLRRRQRMSISRRRSIDKLAVLAEVSDAPPPDLFNLLDLLVMGLKSKHSQTVTATLRLVSIIIRRHHIHVISTLFKTRQNPLNTEPIPVGVLTRQLTQLLDFAVAITNTGSLDLSYECLLNDVQVMLEEHSCSSKIDANGFESTESHHSLAVSGECKVFPATTGVFQTFFGNDTMTNLALTEVITALASCRHIPLQGWLLPPIQGVLINEGEPPNILVILADHVEQIRKWRAQFPEWDSLIASRKTSLMRGDDGPGLSKLRSTSGKSGQSWSSTTDSVVPPSPHSEASKQSSRPTTPRGRKIPRPEAFGSIDGALATAPSIQQSPKAKAIASSPFRQTLFPGTASVTESLATTTGSSMPIHNLLQTQVRLSIPNSEDNSAPSFVSLSERMKTLNFQAESTSAIGTNEGVDSGAVTPSPREGAVGKTSASLSHVLTNAVILQEFVLEIAAVLQIRASLFGEVGIE